MFIFCRLIHSAEVHMKVDEWESMMMENELLPEGQKKVMLKLEDMQVHNWQGAAIGAIHELAEAYLLGKFYVDFI